MSPPDGKRLLDYETPRDPPAPDRGRAIMWVLLVAIVFVGGLVVVFCAGALFR